METKSKIVVTGKRKASVARATIIEGTGKVTINNKPYELQPMFRKLMIDEPLRIAKNILGNVNYDISIRLNGGGQEAGIEAARLAIARALVKATRSNDLKKAFSAYDKNLLVADTRRKEDRKPNDSKARASMQKSYR
jgi:small subunit ribosomal protein S9